MRPDVWICTCGLKLAVDLDRFDKARCPSCKESLVWGHSTTLKCKRCGAALGGDEVNHSALRGVCTNCAMSRTESGYASGRRRVRTRRGSNPFIHLSNG